MASASTKEVTVEFQGLIRVYKDGTLERLWTSHDVPATPNDPKTGVASKDVDISPSSGQSGRLYLPKLAETATTTTKSYSHNHLGSAKLAESIPKNLPVLVYFHGGGFCIESAFSNFTHPYMNTLASQAQVLIVSVEYRLAPEHPLPTAYEDCWEALNWAASLSDPWLADHGEINALFIGGDSAGANIVHNIAMRVANEKLSNGVTILGAFLSHPFFLDEHNEKIEIAYKIWDFVYPNAPGGWECPMLNPMGVGAPSLAKLGCGRVLVVVSSNDVMRDTGVRYYEAVKEGGFEGQVELFEVEGEDHCFHVSNLHSDNAQLLFQRLASFLSKQ